MALYLEACIEEAGDDAAFIAKALGTIARARGMSQLAKDTGLGRESLYKALSGDGNPCFATILKVTHALGFKLQVQGQGKDIKKSQKSSNHRFRPTAGKHALQCKVICGGGLPKSLFHFL